MYSIVYTTTKDENEAKIIASKLIEQKLAACVNVHPIDSMYMWEGQIKDDREIALTIKTVSTKVNVVTECIRNMHSYELPAIISWKINGEKEYLKWITESTDVKIK
jgi:periplasmic divalent cation tolerance protein